MLARALYAAGSTDGAAGTPDGTLATPSSPSVNVLLAAIPEAPSGARRAVGALARTRVADLHAVELAVSEAVNNAVLHAYRDRDPAAGPGEIHVTAVLRADELRVTVADEGVGMRPRLDSPGAGLGLALMGTLADRMDIDQAGRGTRVTLAFRVTPCRYWPGGRDETRRRARRCGRRSSCRRRLALYSWCTIRSERLS